MFKAYIEACPSLLGWGYLNRNLGAYAFTPTKNCQSYFVTNFARDQFTILDFEFTIGSGGGFNRKHLQCVDLCSFAASLWDLCSGASAGNLKS
jgi:hypothetical protein